MKKILSMILTIMVLLLLVSAIGCNDTNSNSPTEVPTGTITETSTDKPTEAPTDKPAEAVTDNNTQSATDIITEVPTSKPTEAPTTAATENNTEKPTEALTEASTESPVAYAYTSFTPSEKAQLMEAFGELIPFIPNDEYYLEEYSNEEYDEYGYNFYTYGNTETEFEVYLKRFSTYVSEGEEADEYGDTWHFFSAGDFYIDVSYYFCEGDYVVDVYVYRVGAATPPTTTPENDYGTQSAPLTTSQALSATSGLKSGEVSDQPFYVKGKVVSIGSKGNYYQSVYITDGTKQLLIYTINMGSGVSGFDVGDEIVAYGYIKNYNGTIEFATNYINNSPVYVVCVSVTQSSGSSSGSTTHTYTAFKSNEKAQLENMFGFAIPFIPNDEYYFETYSWEEYGEYGFNIYTIGNTQAEFDAYHSCFSGYTNDGTDFDDDGDTWYFFSKGDVNVDMAYYLYDGDYVVDIYVYIIDESGDWDDGWDDNTGDDWGDTEDVDLITNSGAGLPDDDGDGIYDIDFTDAEYIKNVTEQGYYIDGCPTTGSPAVLVIPVEFSDVTAQGKGYTVQNIKKIFNGTGLNYYSVHDYFFTSSYGALDLDITVLDSWFRPKNSSSYYENSTMVIEGYEIANGDQLIIDEALAYLASKMDLSKFDSDNNGMIDAVVLVTTLDIDSDSDFHWAYRYWNMLTDEEGYNYEYDKVSANDYAWIPYEFMFEYTDEYGDVSYDKTNPLNTYTFIHEFSHVLGSDDYYDTEYVEHPLGGYDVMDAMVGDHNPYTKFNYGWITSSKLITTDTSVTVKLDAFSKNGDTIIIANNWDASLGVYQEYYVIMYYTASGLNSGEGGYFEHDGIVVYHINASLYKEIIDGEVYYDVYNTNTDASGDYGTKDKLIEYVKGENDHYTYVAGDTMPEVYDDFGEKLGYTFTVVSINGESATLTFEKIA